MRNPAVETPARTRAKPRRTTKAASKTGRDAAAFELLQSKLEVPKLRDGLVDRSALVSRLRATGMPIRDVRRYADLVRAGAGNEQERLELLRDHRRAVLDQLAEVQDHLGAIDRKIGIYVDHLERTTV